MVTSRVRVFTHSVSSRDGVIIHGISRFLDGVGGWGEGGEGGVKSERGGVVVVGETERVFKTVYFTET